MSDHVGVFELLLLMAVVARDREAYGVTIRRDLEAATGRDISSGAVYTTLDRLERRGFVTSRLGDPAEVRGNRPRRYYRLTASGKRVLSSQYGVLQQMARRAAPKLSNL